MAENNFAYCSCTAQQIRTEYIGGILHCQECNKPMKIGVLNWQKQDGYYGLNYPSAWSKFGDYSFSIRYDYDGDNRKKPDCNVCIRILYKNHSINCSLFSKNVESAIDFCEEWIKQEVEDYVKLHFSLIK